MRTMWISGGVFVLATAMAGCGGGPASAGGAQAGPREQAPVPPVHVAAEELNVTEKVVKTAEEWRQSLSPEQFHVLREKGTERAFTGVTWDNHEPGIYRCAGCALPLFGSDTKFDSGTGWPSFWQPIDPKVVENITDRSWGMRRTEVTCARCGGHLGHVFDDGPKPTGQRYCMNSAALSFEKK
jgi:peptide-methionine (R)-S-oxide reductase